MIFSSHLLSRPRYHSYNLKFYEKLTKLNQIPYGPQCEKMIPKKKFHYHRNRIV